MTSAPTLLSIQVKLLIVIKPRKILVFNSLNAIFRHLMIVKNDRFDNFDSQYLC